MHHEADFERPAGCRGRPDSAKRTVNVHCLAGSSFELDIDLAETGWEVAERIAAKFTRAEGSNDFVGKGLLDFWLRVSALGFRP